MIVRLEDATVCYFVTHGGMICKVKTVERENSDFINQYLPNYYLVKGVQPLSLKTFWAKMEDIFTEYQEAESYAKEKYLV